MKQPFACWASGAVAGVMLAPWLVPDLSFELVWIAILLSVLSIAFHIGSRWRISSSLPLFAIGVLCGISWSLFNLKSLNSWSLHEESWRIPTELTIRVTEIVQETDFRDRIDGCIVAAPSSWQLPSSGRSCQIHLRIHRYGERPETPRLGETWHISGRFRPAVATLNEGVFDYERFLFRHRIRVSGTMQQGTRVARPPLWSLHHWRGRIYSLFAEHREEFTTLDIILALSLGERHWLTDERWRMLQATGLAHLMAISGLHLTLVFGSCWWLLQLLMSRFFTGSGAAQGGSAQLYHRRLWPLYAAWCLAFLYAALANFSIATLRAFVLVSLLVLAKSVQVKLPSMQVLLYAVLMVFIIDPVAWMDAGFWLSAGAVAAIFAWQWRVPQPLVQGIKSKAHALWRLEVMLTLMLLPLSILFFQGTSLIAPVTNLILIPVFTVVVIPFSLFAVLLLPILPTLSVLSWRLLDWVLTPVLSTLDWLALQPWSWWTVQSSWPVWGLVGWIGLRYLPAPRIVRWQWGVFAIGFGLLTEVYRPVPEWAIHILDVGQGSAAVVQRGRRALILDTGPGFPDSFDAGHSVVVPFLRHHRLQPEWAVLSHAHRDHTGGYDSLRQAFPNLQSWGSGAGHWPCKAGQQWLWEGIRIRALAPLPGPSFGPNNDSCVLQLEYRGQRVLFPGDSELVTEKRMVGRYGSRLKSDVLIVPHHGSRTSSQALFLDAVQPRYAVISRGLANQFNMPHTETLKRYEARPIKLFDTALHGQVSLYLEPESRNLRGATQGEVSWRIVTLRQQHRRRWYARRFE
ncbi:MAG: DNA internalization-related competence protein ComEC/Rec2 [Idiomarina sp.]|nr:DNA internalization-related competence protein ComEC/Rec2 [Idiomarina sp.]